MKTLIVVNDNVIPLNEFTQTYIGEVIHAIARSLGVEADTVHLLMQNGDIQIVCDGETVPIRKEFVRTVITGTLKGMLSPLRGVFEVDNVSIVTY